MVFRSNGGTVAKVIAFVLGIAVLAIIVAWPRML
jgi:hypothetical protein